MTALFDYDAPGPVRGSDGPAPPRSVDGGGPSRARVVVLSLLALKLLITTWNCAVFDGRVYDDINMHAPRARTGGLGLEGRVYNPPLYYLPAYPLAASQARERGGWPEAEVSYEAGKVAWEDPDQRTADERLLGLLRWTNLFHVSLFYVAWLGIILPRLLRNRWSRFGAALLLLGMPGYQKLAAMVHPDAAMLSSTSAMLAVFVWCMTEDALGPAQARRMAWLAALLGGLAALSRPFGVLSAAAGCAAATAIVWHGSRSRASEKSARAAQVIRGTIGPTLLAAACTLAWPAYQVARLGDLAPAYSESYTDRFEAARGEFRYGRYFSSFYVIDLIRRPNRWVRQFDRDHDRFHNRYGNSFWTLLYSDTWADHWLYFSGPMKRETRVVSKRVALVAALPTIPWLGWRAGAGVASVVTGLKQRRREDHALVWTALLLFFALGAAMFLYWHLSDGLTPGKNSSVKFIYNAHLYPIAVVLAFKTPLVERARQLALGYLVLLFAALLPVSVFVPSWLVQWR